MRVIAWFLVGAAFCFAVLKYNPQWVVGEPAMSSYELFIKCQDELDPSGYDLGAIEVCAQKHEELWDGGNVNNGRGGFVSEDVFEVQFSNPFEWMITNVEVQLLWRAPGDNRPTCQTRDDNGCRSVYVSGRAYVLPKQHSGKIELRPNWDYGSPFVDGKPVNWTWKVQSIRYLKMGRPL